ncbi:BCL-6 corepressor-like protein 1 [Helianthus annuus]|uniref:BCL-6 corepressor-like protein 1 n=1 Tax=Helianthus annuus TaxID=4232 RepID=UPI000B8F9859|nr:BCL-6 corepressor-like protein 1 [Helianthus annuus]
MSSSESGLSDTDDPMAMVSDDEIAPKPEIFTSDTDSEPDMIPDDEDDFQPFALPDFGDDLPLADGIPDEDPFVIPIPVHDHLIIDHSDSEHVVALILAPVPLMVILPEDWPFDDLFDNDFALFVDGPPDDAHGDGELNEDVVDIPLLGIPVIEISSDSSLHSVSDSFESVTSSALQPVNAPADPEPIPAPEPLPDLDPIPFGLPDIAPLIPDPVPAPVDPPVIEPVTPPLTPAPADVAPFHPVESDVHRLDLPIVFLLYIPAPLPGVGTSGQQPSHDPHVSAAFPHIPQSVPSTHFTSSPLDEPLRWMLELEMTPRPLPYPCQSAFVPPRSSPSPFSHPPAPLTPFPEFDTSFLTVEQQISYLLRHVYQLEEELAHVRNLFFVPPPPSA